MDDYGFGQAVVAVTLGLVFGVVLLIPLMRVVVLLRNYFKNQVREGMKVWKEEEKADRVGMD